MPRPYAQLVCPQVTGERQQQCVLGTALLVVVAAADYQGFSHNGSKVQSRHWAPCACARRAAPVPCPAPDLSPVRWFVVFL